MDFTGLIGINIMSPLPPHQLVHVRLLGAADSVREKPVESGSIPDVRLAEDSFVYNFNKELIQLDLLLSSLQA